MRGFAQAQTGRARTEIRDQDSVSRGGLYDDVRAHLAYMFEVVVRGEQRKRSLRSSSLPYCPVLDVVVPKEPDEMDLRGALFTSLGTAAHLALQAFATLGHVGAEVFGNWKCPRCASKSTEPHFRMEWTCPNRCNDAPIYEELSYRFGIMTGHSDLVIRYRGGHWVVHEYKTIGRRPRQPKRQHLLQARTYCEMLYKQYRIRASYVIIYVGRENLEVWPFGPYDSRHGAQQAHDWTTRSIVGFRAASVARRESSLPNLLEVARCRPCTDLATHDEYMARRHAFSKTPCSMLGNCSKSDRHVARIMQGLLE